MRGDKVVELERLGVPTAQREKAMMKNEEGVGSNRSIDVVVRTTRGRVVVIAGVVSARERECEREREGEAERRTITTSSLAMRVDVAE
jgi:hypothetical protein